MIDEPTILRFGNKTVTISPGTSVTFGRTMGTEAGGDGSTEQPAERHIGLSPNQRLHTFAGRLEVDASGWVIENLGRWLHLRMRSPGHRDHIDIEPGRALRGPWPDAAVEIATGDEVVSFEIHCPSFDDSTRPDVPYVGSSGTIAGLGLDREAGYFLAAIALCEPRLRDPSCDEVATVDGVARTLSRASGTRVTTKAAERRLAHLRSKIGIGADTSGGSGAGMEVRDASRQTADLLIRTGVVSVDDLALLEPADRSTPERGQ